MRMAAKSCFRWVIVFALRMCTTVRSLRIWTYRHPSFRCVFHSIIFSHSTVSIIALTWMYPDQASEFDNAIVTKCDCHLQIVCLLPVNHRVNVECPMYSHPLLLLQTLKINEQCSNSPSCLNSSLLLSSLLHPQQPSLPILDILHAVFVAQAWRSVMQPPQWSFQRKIQRLAASWNRLDY